MKKLYTLLFFSFALTLNAQNLAVNPTFADGLTGWNAGFSSKYTLPALVTTDGNDDKNSVMYDLPTATTGFYQEIPVAGGKPLEVSFYYKATGDDTDGRIWSNYTDADGVVVYQAGTIDDATPDPLRNNNEYLAPATTWTKHTVTVTTPANAVKFTLAVRAYKNGTVSFDQFFVSQGALSLKQNTISGLNIYPNPVTNGNLYISSDSNEIKAVTIFDVLGKQVLKANVSNQVVNVSHLSKGVYILKIIEAGQTASRKIVIN